MAVAQLALVPYEPDTEVVEIEEPPVHVKIADEDGVVLWHRQLAGSNGRETACGNIIDHRLTLGHRYETCEGDLCPDCFTTRELVKAALANNAERRRNS